MGLKEVQEPFSSSSRGPIHKDRRLQIEELDEWWTHKLKTHDKPKLRQNELSTFPYQLNVGDKVLLDAAYPHIVTAKSNKEIPLTVLRSFPFGTVEVCHPKFGTFKVNNTRLKPYFDENDSRNEEFTTQTQPSTRACLGSCENRAKISQTQAMINHHGRATRPWANLPIQHGCGSTYTGVGEAIEARNSHATRPCSPTRPSDTGMDKMSDVPKFKIRESQGPCSLTVCPKIYK
ncbi:hypothetical protein GOBAR_AA10664 [Gossypium barbadense]|uniref:Uncharacterized protein n=1 Tax=Gossypium barbadense TaxID=3634 RepID=A0A2P5Y2Z6_GOSBA|nr:hypothetical protein GOBAR_AA10664 [Gossypium barbadense]